MLVNAEYPGVQVPSGFVSDGQIVLNVAPSAIRNLQLGNDAVSFDGRFGGAPHSLYVPCAAVMAIYAKENGQGMVFDIEPVPPEDGPAGEGPVSGGEASRPAGRPSLKVVK